MRQSPTQDSVTFPSAELDRRFYAFAVDRLIAWGVFAGASFLAWRFFFSEDQLLVGIGVIVGAVLLVSLLYAVLLGVAGITPGKALVGLRVVRHDDGRPIGVLAALVRTTLLGAAALPTFGLGAATLAWTAVMDPGGRRRGWHDHLVKAAVVDVRPAPEISEAAEERPRQVVNLTAMRLMPTPPPAEIAAPARAPRPTTPPARPVAPPPTGAPVRPAVPAPAPPSPPAAPPAASPAAPPAATPAAPPAAPPAATPVAPAPSPTPRDAPAIRPAVPAPVPAPVPVPVPTAAAPGSSWRVTFDTGETFVVEGLALVGRRPEARAGEPVRHLVPLRSTDMSVSKTHAQFQVVPDGSLVVMDRGSTNGSVVIRQGVSKPLTAGRPATLLDGDTVRFGDRQMTAVKEQG